MSTSKSSHDIKCFSLFKSEGKVQLEMSFFSCTVCNPKELYLWLTFKQRGRKHHKPWQFTVVSNIWTTSLYKSWLLFFPYSVHLRDGVKPYNEQTLHKITEVLTYATELHHSRVTPTAESAELGACYLSLRLIWNTVIFIPISCFLPFIKWK